MKQEIAIVKISDLNLQYIVDEKGKKVSVILPIEAFEALLEDMDDLATILERQDEETISHEEVIGNLKVLGML